MLDGLDEIRKAVSDHLWEIVTACTGAMLGVKNLSTNSKWVTLSLFLVSLIFAFAAVPPLLAWIGISEVNVYRPIALFVLALVALRIIEALPAVASKIKDIRLPFTGGNAP